MVLTLRQAGYTHFNPGNWFVYCVVLFFSLTLYILSLTPYFLQEQSESVLTKCERSKDYRAKIKGGYCWLSLPGWQHAAFTHTLGLWSQLYPPSFTGLSTNVSHLAHCNLSGSALFKQEDRGEERTCWIFWHKPPICFSQLNRDLTKIITVAHSQTYAIISQEEKEINKSG